MLTGQDAILNEIKVRLVKAINPKKIFLFGSRAKGTARNDSDYDILVLISQRMQNQKFRLKT